MLLYFLSGWLGGLLILRIGERRVERLVRLVAMYGLLWRRHEDPDPFVQ